MLVCSRWLTIAAFPWARHCGAQARKSPSACLPTDPQLTHHAWLALFDQRLRQAIQLRTGMLDEGTDACRLVFSEADQLPGLIVDRYGDLILFEILAKALDRDDIREAIVDVLRSELAPLTIVERSDARIRELEQLSEPVEGPLYSRETRIRS